MSGQEIMSPPSAKGDAVDCLFCRKASGTEPEPIGGYIVSDGTWIANHAKPTAGDVGTLLVSSRRHFLDFADIAEAEMLSLRRLLGQLFPAIKEAVGASRVYFLTMGANQPHFHAWLIPQPETSDVKAFDLLASERSCTEESVVIAAQTIREALGAVT
jgi:diadenosine tetraphosphate (Ap4A) HIT family hydrolase